MRILVEQSGYDLNNMGDLAMLQVAIARLQQRWSDAQIQVFTNAVDALIQYCPNTHPLSPAAQKAWFKPVYGRLGEYLPSPLNANLADWGWQLRRRSPHVARHLVTFGLKARRKPTIELQMFLDAIHQADLVIATGGGYITDTFAQQATIALGILGLAHRLGKPTAMVGHGIGPLNLPSLRLKAKAVLPHVDMIATREKRASVPLLHTLGVDPTRIITTGDDAISLVYEHRTDRLGNGIGINLRIANYSGVDASVVPTVRSVLHAIAREKQAELVPVPISRSRYGLLDADAIRQLMDGYDPTSDGGRDLDTPLKVIQQTGRCRVVVTGSYHAGVFALAQGIPVIGLAQSDYYIDKFQGLADQFGTGCTMLMLNDADLSQKLMAAIESAWNSAEAVREPLLEAARQQIAVGQAAYQRIFERVNVRSLQAVS